MFDDVGFGFIESILFVFAYDLQYLSINNYGYVPIADSFKEQSSPRLLNRHPTLPYPRHIVLG